MTAVSLKADCGSCAALCCVGLAFDASELFAHDKAAGEPCRHLSAGGGCGIHAARAARGYAGCIAYDCQGAGQRVTALFARRSWQDEPDLRLLMVRAFGVMTRIHTLLALLDQAALLPLSAGERAEHAALLAGLDPPEGWSTEALDAFRPDAANAGVRRFLGSLRHHVAGRTAGGKR